MSVFCSVLVIFLISQAHGSDHEPKRQVDFSSSFGTGPPPITTRPEPTRRGNPPPSQVSNPLPFRPTNVPSPVRISGTARRTSQNCRRKQSFNFSWSNLKIEHFFRATAIFLFQWPPLLVFMAHCHPRRPKILARSTRYLPETLWRPGFN